MEIIDVNDEHRDLFCKCLEDWSDEAQEAGPRRAQWCTRMGERGLRAKLAVTYDGQVGGMIQYLPSEESWIAGEGLYFVPCIWVHGHKKGRGNFQKRGMGRALLAAAEKDARQLGAKGMAAWGIWLPFWMKASWYKRQGYEKADRQGLASLVWKPFVTDAKPPRFLPAKKTPPELTPGKVTVTAYVTGWCMAQNLVYERAKRAAAEFGDQVIFKEIDTFGPEAVRQHQVTDRVYVDRACITKGPPVAYAAIKKAIAKQVARL